MVLRLEAGSRTYAAAPPAPAPQTLSAPASAPPGSTGPGPRRDRFVDSIRALATLCVVGVHWLMPEATWDGTNLHIGNALAHDWAWAITWVLQPLAVLFFAAGAAAGYDRARAPRRRWASVLTRRICAVGVPVAVFAAGWLLAVPMLLALGVPDGAVWRIVRMVPQPLWFLAVWAALLALVPLLRRAWLRWRWWVMVTAVAAPLLVDALRFGAGLESVTWLNLMLVWHVPFLAGVAYATDRSTGRRAPREVRTWLGAGLTVGLACMIALTVLGPYPLSMIGMPGEEISNLGPPTAPIVAQAFVQVCGVLLARAAIVRWATRRGPRTALRGVTARSMTIYLWHLTAMFAVVGVALLGLALTLPEPWTATWWATRPLWSGAFAVVLVVLARLFGPFERTSAPRPGQREMGRPSRSDRASVAADDALPGGG